MVTPVSQLEIQGKTAVGPGTGKRENGEDSV